jgi:hypothetical protein
MSILNHFGKVKTTYVPYTSKYPGNKIYGFHRACDRTGRFTNEYVYYTDNDCKTQKNISINVSSWKEVEKTILVTNDRFHHLCRRELVLENFADIIKMITEPFTSSIWKTLNISPLLTISELLWLKVDDVDGRVDHLEKMLMQLMEEHKLLHHRVEALEQKGILYELD